jgi:hypothetical protein
LLGEYVFDIGSYKNYYHIRDLMAFVLEPLLSSDDVNDVMAGTVDWKTLVSRSMVKFKIPESTPSPLKLLALNEEQLTKARDHDAALKLYIQNETKQRDEFARAVLQAEEQTRLSIDRKISRLPARSLWKLLI